MICEFTWYELCVQRLFSNMLNKYILLSILFAIHTANRILLVGGRGRGGGGGSRSSGSSGSSGSSSYRSGSSNNGPSTYPYNVYINMTYEWNTTNSNHSLLFNYSTLWADTKPLIQDSTNKYKIKQFHDKTNDKSDIICDKTNIPNGTFWKQLKFEITTEYKTKLTNYLKDSMFNSSLRNMLNSHSKQEGLQFNEINVKTEEISNNIGAIVGGVIGGVLLLIIVVLCVIYRSCICDILCVCQKECKICTTINSKYLSSVWSKDPNEWVNDNGIFGKERQSETDPFIDGLYDGFYFQYDKKYLMDEVKLIFDGMGSVKGSGTDGVGDYNINGIYSENTARMQLNQIYIEGTGDLSENFGHTVKIRLEYNTAKKQFMGSWYVNTGKYEDTGKWVIQRSGIDDDESTSEGKDKHNVNGYSKVTTECPSDNC
eukprot:270214_1